MSATKYRFVASMTPGFYAVLDRATETRVPGIVTTGTRDGQRLLTYDREMPAARKGGRHKHVIFTAGSVAEMSSKIDGYFTTGEPPK